MDGTRESVDLLIVGGGPTGLSAALLAGRASLHTVVVDAGAPRAAVAAHTHGLFTQDGTSPQELRAIGRTQLARYPTVRNVEGRVLRIHQVEGGFAVETSAGEVHARRVLVAGGWRDDLDATGIPDLARVYGTSVFPCPVCDGWEQRDRTVGVFVGHGLGDQLEHYLMMIAVLSTPRFTVFANGHDLPADVVRAVAAQGNAVVHTPIECLEDRDGHLIAVHTTDGARHPCEAGFVGGAFAGAPDGLLDALGVPTHVDVRGWRVPEVNADGSTAVPGLYVAGDARVGFGGLANAVWQGFSCAAGVVSAVAQERWRAS